METSIDAFNQLDEKTRHTLLERCCGSSQWVSRMLARHPFPNWAQVRKAADEIWASLEAVDWREAFAHHPKIGDLDSLRAKFAQTQAWAQSEQSQVQMADESVLRGLAQGNWDYEEKFGYIFIVCATNRSAEEMLSMLRRRLDNAPDAEIGVAAEQQRQIMQIRLEKMRTELEDGPQHEP